MYGNGYSMAIVLDHRSTATSLTGNRGANGYAVLKEARDSWDTYNVQYMGLQSALESGLSRKSSKYGVV